VLVMRKDGIYDAGCVRGSRNAIGQTRGARIGISLLAPIALLTQPTPVQQSITYSDPTSGWPFGPITPIAPTSSSVLGVGPMPSLKPISLVALRENRLRSAMSSDWMSAWSSRRVVSGGPHALASEPAPLLGAAARSHSA
jgi:hypothetical protein